MVEIIIELTRFALDQLKQLDPRLSSAILSLVVIALLLFIWGPKARPPSVLRPPETLDSPHPVAADTESLLSEIDRLKKIAQNQREELKEKLVPHFSPIEHVYFNSNGITNSVFVLVVALLIFEYTTLADRAKLLLDKLAVSAPQKAFVTSISSQLIPSIEREVAMLLAALAVMVVFCTLVVLIGRVKIGRSIEIINRSFQLSLLIALIVFMAIAIPLSLPNQ
ncbi:hypothetical protein [Rhizobium sp. S96]|uniref:hypothetical protein n=1 Tax=Rhizobium sp. S96 TaxID=3055140 RepID=UPI0025AA403D|nr:hypothetical protein [Rhizobium sp. S96]MDM9619151.1 hypothetical protein [Rhizobium sp. S96]